MSPKRRARLLILGGALLAVVVGLVLQPLGTNAVHLGVALGGLAVAGLALSLAPPVARWILAGVLGLAAVGVAVLPGGPSPQLGAAYIEDVAGFLGTPYVWGGENGFGIDCSGVVRQGLIRANLRLGLAHGNGALLRRALEMTVHDLSAKALGEGARGWTRELFTAPGINAVDERQLQAGDLAVTQDGLHVLVYRGAHVWLEADPVRGRVVEDAAPSAQVGWFTVPVRLMRWTQLE